MALNIKITKVNPITYGVKLSGKLDTETAEDLDRRMEEVWAEPAVRAIRLDLHDLTYISSIGLGSVSKIKKSMATLGGVVLMIGMQPQIARVFEIVKMLPQETVFTSHKEADEYLAAIQAQVLENQRPIHPDGGQSL